MLESDGAPTMGISATEFDDKARRADLWGESPVDACPTKQTAAKLSTTNGPCITSSSSRGPLREIFNTAPIHYGLQHNLQVILTI